uniref:DUF1281_C domain-containing protein n=1 Tax=Parastrongyloides trichosuri TaxID=131310 RepID=A0A0N4ZKZ6_PARTI
MALPRMQFHMKDFKSNMTKFSGCLFNEHWSELMLNKPSLTAALDEAFGDLIVWREGYNYLICFTKHPNEIWCKFETEALTYNSLGINKPIKLQYLREKVDDKETCIFCTTNWIPRDMDSASLFGFNASSLYN